MLVYIFGNGLIISIWIDTTNNINLLLPEHLSFFESPN